MKLAQRKLDGMQGIIQAQELMDDIAADTMLEQQLTTIASATQQ